MSRVDEALRQARGTAGVPDDRGEATVDNLRVHAVDPSILERYAVERPMKPRESVQPQPAQIQQIPALPRVDRPVHPIAFNPALEGKLVVSRDMAPVAIEQYRRLAAVLHELRLQQGLKTVMMSSAVSQEGKTLSVANLALTLSEAYHRRVLLIDADLRRPSIHDVFGVPNGTGLADIARNGGLSAPYLEISTHLSILTAGRAAANPLAMLTSDNVRAAVSAAAERFDWVLIDTPPVGLLPDAQLIARLCDGVLFVIAAGSTPYALVKRSIDELGADRIIGTVLNRVKETRPVRRI
jgi:capsular exopolysaccharide synthesis family protein